MPVNPPQKDDTIDARQLLVPAVLAVCFLVFLARLFQLQVVEGEDLSDRSRRESEQSTYHLAPRGQITDRQGRILATVRPVWVVQAVPAEVVKHKEAVAEVAALLGITPEDISERIKGVPAASPVDVFVNATAAQAIKIAEARGRLPGFSVDIRSMRTAAEPTALTHILGYVGRPDEAAKKSYDDRDLPLPTYVGREGLEKQYESYLTGVMGQSRMTVDSRGRPVQRVAAEEVQPIPGNRLTLSIDLDLQKEAMRLLAGRKGAVAAIDPRTGEVLALASMPSFDVTLFEGGISSRQYAQLDQDPAKPFQRRATQGLYSPGSTFKIVTALAAARAGKLNLGHHEFCNGGLRIGRRLFRCNNHSRGMSLNFENAFRLSCNTYFMDLALQVGPEALRQASLDLGLGKDTGIDLPSESSGRLPLAVSTPERHWYQGDTANFGIGQGDTVATPLQMAMLISAVANDGRAYQPHLVKAKTDPITGKISPVEPQIRLDAAAPEGFFAEIREAMRKVVASGTAKRAQIPGLSWGGKTGSTQHSRGGKTHSWFVGLAPIDNPTIAIAVLAEEAGHGGEVAAPIAAGVVTKWIQSGQGKEDSARSSSVVASR